MTIEKVQQCIISALICAVASFPVGALVATSVSMDQDDSGSDAVVLCVMAVAIGVLAVGAGRLVHRIEPLSPYVLMGAIPGLATIAYILAR
jgi:hypothetical protein|nr:hypothetical protein [Aeromicrobium sp.]